MSDLIPVRWTFYITPWQLKLKYLVNQLISIRTWSKYSHCEAWVPLPPRCFGVTHEGTAYAGTSYTSTMRGKANGTVSRDASGVYDHPDRWVYVETMLTQVQYDCLIGVMDIAVAHNKGYATKDIMKFLVPFYDNDEERFICSEFCNDMAVIIELITGKGIVSPQAFLNKLCALRLTIKPMKG